MHDYIRYGREALVIELEQAQRLPQRLGEQFSQACELLFHLHGKVIVAGVGKSGHIGKKIAASLASTGTPAFFVHPAEALHGDLGMITRGDAVIFISYSGRAKELTLLAPILKEIGVPIIAITGEKNSPLAEVASYVLDVHVDQEACPIGLAPTSSTVNTLMMGDALTIALMKARGFTPDDFARSHPGGSLGAKLLNRVKDIMRTGSHIPKIFLTANVQEAMLELSRTGLGLVAICDQQNKLQGVFTDGDLRRLLIHGGTLQDAIEQVMTKPSFRLPEQWRAGEALQALHDHCISAAPVVDRDGYLVGAINLHDLHEAGVG